MDNRYFYGVDYKKMHLFCKIKDVSSYYLFQRDFYKKFDYNKYYEVLLDNREEKEILIEVFCEEDNSYCRVFVSYDYINFYYFFDNLDEPKKEFYDDLPF